MKKRLLAAAITLSVGALFTSISEAKTHALVVGIGTYNDKNISTLYDKPVNDANSIKKLIEERFKGEKDIHLLLNEQATKAKIINQLTQLAKTVKSGDTVIFYYSGHGDQVPNDNPEVDFEKDNKDEVIVNVDARLQGGGIENIIRDDTLEKLFSAIEAKGAYVLVIMDSCHSGTIGKSIAEPLSAQLAQIAYEKRRNEEVLLRSTPTRTILTAAASGQVAFADSTRTNSLFTGLLLEGIEKKLADGNGNGVVSYGELHRYLLKSSETYCIIKSKQCGEKGLTPTLEIYPAYQTQAFTDFPTLTPKKPSSPKETYNILEESFAQNLSDKIQIAIKHQSKSLKLDDEIFVELKSKVKGHLILLDVNAKGEMVQIFPNAEHPKNLISSGKKYYFPTNAQQKYGFFATEKGNSRLYAIVTEDAIDLSEVLKKDLEPNAIENPALYAGKLANKLNAPWTGEDVSRLSHYSVAAIDYIVK